MLNKVMEFAGSSTGKKVIIGGLAILSGAIGVCILGSSKGGEKVDPTLTDNCLDNGVVEVSGEVTDADEDSTTEE